ncbi:MAG: UvrD-helicase domain-containing protein [Clostridia bacterium]|nr:UvrD-helicase domain-containing protein [Clostridia bacterium]
MGLLSFLFGKKSKKKSKAQKLQDNIKSEQSQKESEAKAQDAVKISLYQEEIKEPNSQEGKDLIELSKFLNNLLCKTEYISKKEYTSTVGEWKNTVEYFLTLQKSKMLFAFCQNDNLSAETVEETLQKYTNIETLVESHNDTFVKEKMVSEKQYLDNILKTVDPNILLDDDQRRVVLTDEDYSLVIAGAGAGKTTTVAAKVKYLVEKKGIKPSQILVVSFTNKAVQELRDKINTDLGINCPISTFHAVGNAVIHKQNPDKLNIVDDSKLYFVLQDYFKNSILKNESLVNNLVMFFASYFDAPYEGNDLNNFFNKIAKSNFNTLKSDLNEFQTQVVDSRTKKSVTIQNEVLRSAQEVEIANYLYLNNIDYEYEPVYRYDILEAKKPYTPDFKITQGDKVAYIEHFGITQDGKNDRYSQDQLDSYKKAINHKILLHKQHGTTLIYTFSKFNDNRALLEHLKEELERIGFEIKPRPNKEVIEKLVSSEENRYIRKLLSLICRFISNFKTNGFTSEEFNRMYHQTQNVRTKLFLDICNDCYLEYERYLKENDAVDFQDMINKSARILREVKEMKQKLDFKYIIVDEYQDISRQRFDLVTALADVTEAKIIAVGDDWQSIYAFSGSDITLFTKFKEKMGYANLLKIVKTYRNAQEVIDIAGSFVQKNKAQIRKKLISPKHISDPVIIYTYDSTLKSPNGDRKTGANYAIARSIETALEQIIKFNQAEGKPETSSILLLGRFGFDGEKLEKTGLFEYINRGSKLKSVKYPKLNITFMTAHASKGLGYDNVIIINGKNETYGFPSKIEDDPVLSFVIKGDRSIDYAEERRLFYVAMTRTKNRVFCIAPEQNPSEFLLEIKHNYKNVVLRGEWNEEPPQNTNNKKVCPICGYPLQYRYKNAYGLKLYLCTNEPEACSFMTNEYKAGKLSILKCDRCRDGYLVAKPGREGKYFLGCTNYKSDSTGCSNNMSREQYYEMFNLKPDDTLVYVKPEKTSEHCPKIGFVPAESSTKAEKQIDEVTLSFPIKEIVKPDLSRVFYKGNNLNDIVYTVLSCLVHISERKYYGTTVLVDVLRGSSSEKINKAKLNTVLEYGSLSSLLTREELFNIIDWLIENHFILKTRGTYPVLHPTNETQNYEKTITDNKLKDLFKYLSR